MYVYTYVCMCWDALLRRSAVGCLWPSSRQCLTLSLAVGIAGRTTFFWVLAEPGSAPLVVAHPIVNF